MYDFVRGKARFLAAPILATVTLGSAAQNYPSRPIQMVVPFVSGGGLDMNARSLAESMAENLGQPIAVINRVGAAGTIGLTAVASAQPDGYTLAFTPAVSLSSEPHRLKSIAYGLDSFRYVCQVFDNIVAIAVRDSSPYRSLEDILADARKNPDKVSYGTAGTGSIPHLGASDIETTVKVTMTHVPYNDATLMQDLIGGRLSFGIVLVSSITGQLKSGALRLIAVLSERRHPSFAEVPTLKEAGVPVVQPSFGGVLAPAHTPDAVLDRLQAACRVGVASPGYQEWARNTNQVVNFRPGKEFERNVREDSRLKAATIQRLGLGNP
jgi:tripartite-type tricarboxylate transporter receptor subunit TctC